MARKVTAEKIPLGDQMIQTSRLHLDTQNPRHEPLSGDTEVIAQLCNEELIAELAHDIATRGTLSPLDVLGVIPYDGHPGHYIAVEGNRRACALILLTDPARAPTPTLQAQLRRIAATTQVPREVKVHIFANRSAAKPWIDLRHLGPQGGIGVREWNADQKTRAAGGNSKTSSRANTLALAVLDRLTQLGALTSEQRGKVSLTTITRYLGTPGVRAILGLGSSSELLYTYDINEVDTVLRQLILDSITPDGNGNYTVNSRSNSADRLAYATELRTRGISPSTPIPTPTIPPSSVKVGTPKPLKKRSARNPANLPTLFDRGFTVTCRDPVLLRLRDETLNLLLKDFPFSANYLLRAFIEQTMILFATKRGKYSSNMSDEKLTQICAAELQAMGVTGKAFSVINKAGSNSSQPYSLHSLGHAVHGASIPTSQSLRAICDTWQPSLRAMLDAL